MKKEIMMVVQGYTWNGVPCYTLEKVRYVSTINNSYMMDSNNAESDLVIF